MHAYVQDALVFIDHYVALYGVFALFGIILLESLGFPLPGESILVASSFLALRGDVAIFQVYLAAFFGAVLGDTIGYLIGHRFGPRVLDRIGPPLGLTPERRERFEAQMRSRGVYLVATARFIVILRQLNGIIAGSSGMPYRRFLAANVVGAAAWTAMWGLGPYFFADLFKHFAP
jgi:membrane protein DedA with SNARE-associated domain